MTLTRLADRLIVGGAIMGAIGIYAVIGASDAPARPAFSPSPIHTCTAAVFLFEDGSWSGDAVYYDDALIADHWEVADAALAGTTRDEADGTVTLLTDSGLAVYEGTTCTVYIDRD